MNEEVKRGASCSNNDALYNSKASLLIVRGIVVVILPDNNDALEKRLIMMLGQATNDALKKQLRML